MALQNQPLKVVFRESSFRKLLKSTLQIIATCTETYAAPEYAIFKPRDNVEEDIETKSWYLSSSHENFLELIEGTVKSRDIPDIIAGLVGIAVDIDCLDSKNLVDGVEINRNGFADGGEFLHIRSFWYYKDNVFLFESGSRGADGAAPPLTYLFFALDIQVSVGHTFVIEVADDFLRGVLAKSDNLNTSKVRMLVPIGILDCVINHFVEVKGEEPGKPRIPTPKSSPVDCLVFLDEFVGDGEVLLVVFLESLLDGFRVILDNEVTHIRVSFYYTTKITK